MKPRSAGIAQLLGNESTKSLGGRALALLSLPITSTHTSSSMTTTMVHLRAILTALASPTALWIDS